MELLLVLVLGGVLALVMRPLKDWYVVELSDASGASLEKTAFARLEAAQQAFDQTLAAKAHAGAATKIHLWHAEARSRREALKSNRNDRPAEALLKSADL
jgi:hypothetical protein